MGSELDAYVYDYNAGGNDGCPLLVLTPVEKPRHLFCRGRGGGDAAAAAASNWDFRWDWVTMTTLMTIQPRLLATTITRNNQIERKREEEKGRVKVEAALAKRGGGLQ